MMTFRYLSKENTIKIPRTHGVYALGGGKVILYIGKASNLQERIQNHFRQPSYRDNFFIDQVSRIGYIKTYSDIDALLLESQLIKKYQPKYNVMWKDDKKYFYVGITEESLPRVFLTHQPTSKAQSTKSEARNKSQILNSKVSNFDYIGPFVDGKAIKRVLRILRAVFPYYTTKKHLMVACSYCHLELCPGPNPDQQIYQRNIKNLTAILQGKKTSVLQNIHKEMKQASKEQNFEEAAKSRDQFLALERVMSHAFLLFSPSPTQNLPKHSSSYPLIEKKLQQLMQTNQKISRIEAYDISNIQGMQATGSMVTFIQGKSAKQWYRKFQIHRTGKPNDFAMIKELLSRRLMHPEWPYPNLMIIDGGKGQLSSALEAIKNSKSQIISHKAKSIKVAAIAKRNNELFVPNQPTPFLLKDMRKEVSNLILHIRDEAHRFAISYHRALRKKELIK